MARAPVRGRPALVAAVAVALAAAGAGACRKRADEGGPLRVAFFPNLTHAQALVAQREDLFARELGAPVTLRLFNAGPQAMEALLAGDVDVAYVGPGPAALAYLRSGGEAIQVIAGAVSGGAQLVTRNARSPGELAGKRVASPQIGNTQDIALRAWLKRQGLAAGERPGQVKVTPLANADIVSLFARGELEGAWVPEPWGARLREQGGHVLVDERDLWEGGRFPATLVVATRRALASRRREVVAVLRAHVALTDRWRRDPAGFARAANGQFATITGKPLPDRILEDAFARLEPVSDPMTAQIQAVVRHAQELGYAPSGDLSRLVDPSLLEEAMTTLGGARPAGRAAEAR
jgi:NitT/TauT family transport system substrate-binding protein